MRWRRKREPYEFTALATYNAERARGIVHTPEWDALMAEEQYRFEQSLGSQIPGVNYPAVYRAPKGTFV